MTAGQRIRRRRLLRRIANGEAPTGGGGRRRALTIIGGALVALFVLGLGITGAAGLYAMNRYNSYAEDVVPPEQLIAKLPRGGARIYDRNGTLLYEFVDEFGGLRRPVAIGDIAPVMREATISTEDASFYDNNGLNLKGLVRAGLDNFSPFGGGNMLQGGGGSSITQQLAKNVYIPKEERVERSVDRKLKETVIALELTKKYPKDQILEWYLNSISYGGIYVGVQAASEGYFGKSAKDLSLAEASLLAGIPQSPAAYAPLEHFEAAKERQKEVLDLMVRHGAVTQEQADAAFAQEIVFANKKFDILAPHFVLGPVAKELEARFGKEALYQGGLEVTTTIDMNLQNLGQQVIEERVASYEQESPTSDGHNGALLAIDPKTGEVLAYVGSRDYFRDDIQGRNDNIAALNSPGSTLKPFTYITTFQQGWSTGTMIFDTPASVKDPSTGQTFSPRNPDSSYHGLVPVSTALASSLNVTAFKAIIFAGVDNVVNTLKKAGLTTLNDERGYGPALTLGGVDIRMDDLTYAYSVLAGGGLMHGQEPVKEHNSGERPLDPIILKKVVTSDGKVLLDNKEPQERRVMGANYAYMATSILSDPKNFCLTYNCAGAGLGLTDRASAVKTGTSEPYENSRKIGETWTFGYTPDLVTGVWAGNSDNSPMSNILSTSISWRAWRDFMTQADQLLQITPKAFPRPGGLEERDVCWPSGKLATSACPKDRLSKALFAADSIPTDKNKLAQVTDNWWQLVKIDTRTGLLASSSTPAAFVKEESRLVLPAEELAAWPDLRSWVASQGAQLAPTAEESAAIASAIAISAPTSGQTVSGTVAVAGKADSPDFQSYTLEFGNGENPSDWQQLQSSGNRVSGGVLGQWSTQSLTPGKYTLRLRLTDAKLGELRYVVTVTVASSSSGSGGRTPTATATASSGGGVATPTAVISSPVDGTPLTFGAIQIRGTASSPAFLDAVIEYGESASPSNWTLVARLTSPVANGTLGTWNTTGLQAGTYSVRVTVRDRSLGNVQTTAVYTVR
ncbi:MAG: transglycosylase domain-containing protein [Dehalococcoidia bacterium]|nr:transglycosylase domain-containing protein [Dehalococcoidia bacterium]